MPPYIPPVPGPIQPPWPGAYCTFRQTYYNDVHGSPDGNFYYDKGMISRTIHVAEAGVDQAMIDFMGYGEVFNGNIDGEGVHRYISRTLPHRFPTRPWMVVQGLSTIDRKAFHYADFSPNGEPLTEIQPFTGNKEDGTALPRYKVAAMTFQYVMPHFKIKTDAEVSFIDPEDPTYVYNMIPDEGWAVSRGQRQYSRYISRKVKNQSRMITLPAGLLKDNTAQKRPILEGVAINEAVGIREYTWHQVPEEALPEFRWIEGKNTVNHETFDGCPPGTLLFAGDPDVNCEPNPVTGQYLYSVKYVFHSYILIDRDSTPTEVYGHNYVRRLVKTVADPGPLHIYKIKPVKMTTDGVGVEAGTEIFPSFDFRKLFRPDPL